jgi:CarboxypepD_reg-like domain
MPVTRLSVFLDMILRKLIVLLFFFFTGATAFSQLHNLSGKVFDSRSAQSLPGAIVTMNYKKMQQFTDTHGNFLFDSLPAGNYRVKVFYAGFPVKELEVTLSSNIHNNLLIEMNPPCKYDSARKTGICPFCHQKDKAVPVKYGLPIGKMDTVHYYYAGCEVTDCDPSWYCKRDKQLF